MGCRGCRMTQARLMYAFGLLMLGLRCLVAAQQHLSARHPSHAVDYQAVKADLRALFVDSKDFWPADFGHYGPLFIRMAWHCAGSYRQSDGRGGCDGARQRFDPERSWPDNTNLDKARALLVPLKIKYPHLSFGDLMILAGDTAIESMGGPVLGFCGGRVDDADGSASLELGPTPEQEALAPCPVNGLCKPPLGASTVGLIYVNPEGVMGEPVPEKSAPNIREVFGRMGMNDSETVALIGGGHAFGKAHGACPTGPGPAPNEDPANPWPGTCGHGAMKGKGNNTFTSGFEGPWTGQPTRWSNLYFQNLLKWDWQVHKGPGGNHQWRPVQKPDGPPVIPVMMLTSDVALLKDPEYLELVKKFASDQSALDHAFKHAWYKLTSRDMGPATRCVGDNVPPAQSFQFPLPAPPKKLADFRKVAADIQRVLYKPSEAIGGDTLDGRPYYGALFVTLAWRCASTFRATDYLGGCNGARIRFSPQKDWPANKGMTEVLEVLQGVKDKYGSGLSWADLIVLAGTVSLGHTGSGQLEFCGGRVDAADDQGASRHLAPRQFSNTFLEVRDNAKVMGITDWEVVALAARPRSPTHQKLLGYSGSWSPDPSQPTNQYHIDLLTKEWTQQQSAQGLPEFVSTDGGTKSYMTPADLALRYDAQYAAIAQEYAADQKLFLTHFVSAWTKVMNADRFKGPRANVCDSNGDAPLLCVSCGQEDGRHIVASAA